MRLLSLGGRRLRLGLGLGRWLGLALLLRGGPGIGGRRLRLRRAAPVRCGGLLVALAAVVGDVEPVPLEEQPRARGEPALRLRAALGALRHGLVGHPLELLEIGPALGTTVLVRRHLSRYSPA